MCRVMVGAPTEGEAQSYAEQIAGVIDEMLSGS
jgi:hypothetical protein